jgi:hypothetical protein
MSHKFKIGDIVKLKQYPPQRIGSWNRAYNDLFKNVENKFEVESLGIYNFTGKDDLCITVNNPYYRGWNPEEAFELYQEPESLVGRYLEVLRDGANGSSYRKGQYALIKGINSTTQISCSEGYVFSHVDNDFSMSGMKLMPAGFDPNSVKQPSIEELLAEAARRYPFNTQYLPFSSNGEKYQNMYPSNRPPKALSNGIEVGAGYVYLFNNPGVWAEKEEVDTYSGTGVVTGTANSQNTIIEYNPTTSSHFGSASYPVTPEQAYKPTKTSKKEQAFDDPVMVKNVKPKRKILTL